MRDSAVGRGSLQQVALGGKDRSQSEDRKNKNDGTALEGCLRDDGSQGSDQIKPRDRTGSSPEPQPVIVKNVVDDMPYLSDNMIKMKALLDEYLVKETTIMHPDELIPLQNEFLKLGN